MRFVAGRGAVAERLVRGTAVAELLLTREPPAQRTAGRGAVAERLVRGTAVAERLVRGAAAEQGRRCGARALAQRKSAPAEQVRWQKARAGAGRQILSDSPSDLAITSAAQVLPYVFTAVRGISQSCCTARTNPMPSKGNPTT